MADLIPFHESNGALRVRDVELGAFLGLAKPANIRVTIAKYLKDKKLSNSEVVTQHVPIGTMAEKGTPGRKSDVEFLLTEEAALFIAARSDAINGKRAA